MSDPILAASAWANNGFLVEDIAKIGFLTKNMLTLDATYGRGIWWQRWLPDRLVTMDWRTPANVKADFRNMPFANSTFDAVAYDPPYVCVGGRKTTGMADFHDRYGLQGAPTTPAGVQADINSGLVEVKRVLKDGGVALVKCQDYVSSGALWPGTHYTLTTALALKFRLVDRLEHMGKVRAQPGGRRQLHARRNLSTLFVFRA